MVKNFGIKNLFNFFSIIANHRLHIEFSSMPVIFTLKASFENISITLFSSFDDPLAASLCLSTINPFFCETPFE